MRDLEVLGMVKITETRRGTFHGFVDQIRVTWLRYPYPLLAPLVHTGIPGLRLASVTDIAAMKWAAVSQRGARRDFIDLYFICQNGQDLAKLLSQLPEKFAGTDLNPYHMVKSLSYFDDAEREAIPVMRRETNWETVKVYFRQAQKRLLSLLSHR